MRIHHTSERPANLPTATLNSRDGHRLTGPKERTIAYARHLRDRLRTLAAILVSRSATTLSQRLRLGAGTSLPGMLARRIDPSLTAALSAQLRHGSVVITGTNGKTSTSGLAASVLRAMGLRVWHNHEGANLARGITAALIQHASLTGKLREGGDAAFVFEVDEAAFSSVVAELRPRVVAITNLFRDQLDRYGEVRLVAERWGRALRTLPQTTTLVLNADDPAVAALADAHADGAVLYFGVDAAGTMDSAAGRPEVIDTRTCQRCQSPLSYQRRFYSHIGHWRCSLCDFTRPAPDVLAREITFHGLDGTRCTLATPDAAQTTTLALPGLYNVYNALAATAVGVAFGAAAPVASAGLQRFTPAFGRAEHIQVGARGVGIFLAKNPTGLNEVLRMLASDAMRHHLLLLLNDRTADSEDVSWIWDADLEQVATLAQHLTVGGIRALDLALRLKYAGVNVDRIEPRIGAALAWALDQVPVGETLYIIPTYTAMLAVRHELERQGYTPGYWRCHDA